MAILKRRITLVRDWSADADSVMLLVKESDLFGYASKWRDQVLAEFNDCNVSSPSRGKQPSVLILDPEVNMCFTKGVTATFTGVLEFVYNEDDPALKGAPAAQIIQVVFYGDGFCSGEFRLRDRDDRDVEVWNYLEGGE